MKRYCHYERTGYGFLIKFIEHTKIVREQLIVGRTDSDVQRMKELVDEWTGHDWDLAWFERPYGDIG